MAHDLGFQTSKSVLWNASRSALIEWGVKRGECQLSADGAVVFTTGKYTGRAPNDRFIVEGPESGPQIGWGDVNRKFPADAFDRLEAKLKAHLADRELFVLDCYAGADPDHRIPVRVISESATHILFSETMFLAAGSSNGNGAARPKGFAILHAPSFQADPVVDQTRSEAFILLNFERRLILIGGTAYAGEIKKSVFSVMNYLLPLAGAMPMHCSANYGRTRDDVALFFGLSGTGKTTLSADPDRTLIGDDEHGWTDSGVFNFEGGCYAKVIGITAESEPEIFETTRRYGTILENVVMDPTTRTVDLFDKSITENTRAAYPIDYIPNMDRSGCGGHPKHILMLTCDAFGVLPPVARLSFEQAMYHFLSGYTAKVAGTEAGITEPKATFSACFGAPFMPLPPERYAELLGKRIQTHGATTWLVNTGWSGGSYGVGKRMSLKITRSILKAILSDSLTKAPTWTDPVFRLEVPKECLGVPSEVLNPRKTWSDPDAYDRKARELAAMFSKNFEKVTGTAPTTLASAGPAAI